MPSAKCHRRKDCRLCGGRDLSNVLSLAPTPPANAFVSKDQLGVPQERFPLELFFCESCGHVQLLDVVDPRLLFENYVYVSGTSQVFVKHFRDYAQSVLGRFNPAPGELVVDIGSNDGTLLDVFRTHGQAVLGIDPAREIAHEASARGIETIPEFFSAELAGRIRKERGAATVVTANNVFAHADDLRSIVDGIKTLLAENGVFVFEVSYLADVVSKTLFDTIYHEHLSYHSVAPLEMFFRQNGMRLVGAERVDSHGGSLRGYVAHAASKHMTDPSVASLVALEKQMGLDRAETFRQFARDIHEKGLRLRSLLSDLRSKGKRIAGFGAPAKATTLMFHFSIGPDVIDYIVDDNPKKQGMYTPGFHIPVMPTDVIYSGNTDYLVILAWNFADSIMNKHAAFKEQGGHFIVPLPNIEVN